MGDFFDLETKATVNANNLITQLWDYPANRRCHGISFLFLLLFFTSSACVQGISAQELDGFVYSANGSRLPDVVNVNLCDANGVVIQQSSTASAGRFYFQGLSAADYVLKISADSFEPQEVHVNLQFGNVHGVTVYLEPISSKPTSPFSVATISSHELSMPAHELLLAGRTKLYRENKPQEALNDFLKAQRKAPGYYELNYEIGMAYLNLGQKEKARDNFLKAIDLSKDSYGDPQIALGTLLVDQGSPDEGEKKIQHGLLLNPNSWMGYYQLARVKFLLGQLPEAETAAEQARSLAPKAAINYQLLSIIHLRQKKYVQLLHDIDKYLELDPNSPAGQRARAARDQVLQEIKKEQASESSQPND